MVKESFSSIFGDPSIQQHANSFDFRRGSKDSLVPRKSTGGSYLDTPIKISDATIDDALTLVGHGRFNYLLVICTGMVYFACGLQNGLNAYILPSCKCEFGLTSTEMGLLNALFLAGGMSSSFVSGPLADILGRRPAIAASLLGDSICSLFASTAPTFPIFAALRFVSGILIGGPAAMAFLYMSEYLPAVRRPPYILTVGIFWTVSWMVLPAISWATLPEDWPLHLPIPVTPWRLLVAAMFVPSLLGGLLTLFLPETPCYLASRGRYADSIKVLSIMYATNSRRHENDYPVRSLLVEGPSSQASASKSRVRTALNELKSQLGTLLTGPILSRTFIGCAANFCNMFSYYGLVLWLPELFSRFEVHYSLHPNKTMTVCELARVWPAELAEAEANFAAAESIDAAAACNQAAVNERVFEQTLIISSVCLVANILSAVAATKVGRRTMPVVLNALSCVLAIAVYFVNSTTANLAIASLFQAVVGTANTACNAILVDLFPGNVSALGVVSAVLAGRLGAAISNLVVGSLMDVSCEIPVILIAVMAGVSALLCICVPPPYGKTSKDCCGKSKSKWTRLSITDSSLPAILAPSV